MAASDRMVDPSIFSQLQTKIDIDAAVREQLKSILHELEKRGRVTQSILARAQSTPKSKLPVLNEEANTAIQHQAEAVRELAQVASQHAYYRYNNIWTRDVQDVCFAILYAGWLTDSGSLLTLEDVGHALNVPVNASDDEFHVTIEEYLLALCSLIEELARLAVNAVTLGDYERPVQISRFVKDVHAGFQILNLKNDLLRRRSDGIKYSVKKVEDVVYDLSLRNLIPTETQEKKDGHNLLAT